MQVRLITLAVWIVAVAGALAWVLPWAGKPIAVPPNTALALAPPPALAGAAERLLGTPPVADVVAAPPAPEESRYKLLGVIAPRFAGGSGLALISVDGQPARAVAVGREVDPGTRVIAIAHRRVDLGATPGAPTATLELPAIPEPARGRPGDVPAAPPQGAGTPLAVPPMPAVSGRQRAGAMFGGPRTPGTPPAAPGAAVPAVPELAVEPAVGATDGRSVQ